MKETRKFTNFFFKSEKHEEWLMTRKAPPIVPTYAYKNAVIGQ